MQQEVKRLEKIEASIDEKEDLLYDAFTRLTHTEKKAAEAENRLSGTQREIARAEDKRSQMREEGREMKPEESTRYDRPVYRTDKEKDGWSR